MKLFKSIVFAILISMIVTQNAFAAINTYDGGSEYYYTTNGARVTLPTKSELNITYDENEHTIPKVSFYSSDECYDMYSMDKWNSCFQGTLCDAGDYKVYFRVIKKGSSSTGGGDSSYHAGGWYMFHIKPAEMTMNITFCDSMYVYDGKDHNSLTYSAKDINGEDIDCTLSYTCEYTNLKSESAITEGNGIPSIIDPGKYKIEYTITPSENTNYSPSVKTIIVAVRPNTKSKFLIPSECRSIGEEAFEGIDIIDASFSNDEISIDANAFSNCVLVILRGKKGGTVEKYAKDHEYIFIEQD